VYPGGRSPAYPFSAMAPITFSHRNYTCTPACLTLVEQPSPTYFIPDWIIILSAIILGSLFLLLVISRLGPTGIAIFHQLSSISARALSSTTRVTQWYWLPESVFPGSSRLLLWAITPSVVEVGGHELYPITNMPTTPRDAAPPARNPIHPVHPVPNGFGVPDISARI